MRLLVTNIERESCDDRRFSFEPAGAPRSLTNTQGMQTNCSVDVKGVEEFHGLVQDVCDHQGALVCPAGFTKAALRRAQKLQIALYRFTYQRFCHFTPLSGFG